MSGKRMTLFAVGTALLIAIVVFAGFYLLGGKQTEPIKLPEISENRGPGQDEDIAQSNAVITAQVTPHTVQAVISTLARPTGYHRTIETTLYWSGGSRRSTTELWQRGSGIRLEVTENDQVKHLILTESALYIWYNDDRAVCKVELPDTAEALAQMADAFASIPGYEAVLNLDETLIQEAKLSELDGKRCIYVRAQSRELSYVEEYYIDNDTGLLLSAVTYEGEKAIYEMKSGTIELTVPELSLFCLPGEETPLIS